MMGRWFTREMHSAGSGSGFSFALISITVLDIFGTPLISLSFHYWLGNADGLPVQMKFLLLWA